MGEACAPHTRASVERVHLQARVVGQGESHRRLGHGSRLLHRVLHERRPVLHDVRCLAEELTRRADIELQVGDESTQLFDLPPVARRDDERFAVGRSFSHVFPVTT